MGHTGTGPYGSSNDRRVPFGTQVTPLEPNFDHPQPTPQTLPHAAIFIAWSDMLCEAILRQKGGSFTVAFGWSIALVHKENDGFPKWQVFYMGIDASFRLEHKDAIRHEMFREAYEWIRCLSKEQYEKILSRVTVPSHSGHVKAVDEAFHSLLPINHPFSDLPL